MRMPHDHKFAIFPNRLSFGFVGRLSSATPITDKILVQVRELSLSEDTYDRSKLALAGMKDQFDTLIGLEQRGAWEHCHLAAVTRQGSFRTLCCPVEYECHPGPDFGFLSNKISSIMVAKGAAVTIHKFVLKLPMTNFTHSFFMAGDDKWDGIVHSVKSLAEPWKERTSILKKILCQ